MTLVKKYSLFFLIPLILILINNCNRKSNYIITGSTMGTTYNINIFAPFVDVDSLKNKIDFLLVDINKKMSTYDKSSEISKFNNYEKGKYRVSNDFLNVVDKAIAYSNISKNYDITIKPVLDLWGFDKFQEHLRPDSSDIKNALKYIGIKNIYIEDKLPDYNLFLNSKMTIGTDSLASNDTLSIWSEIKTLKKHTKIDLNTLLTWGCKNGAEFLKMDHLGTFEKGKRPGVNNIFNSKINVLF